MKTMLKHTLIFLLGSLAWLYSHGQSPAIHNYLEPSGDTLVLTASTALPDSQSILIHYNLSSNLSDSLGLVVSRVDRDGIPIQTSAIRKHLPDRRIRAKESLLTDNGELLIYGEATQSSAREYFLMYLDVQTLAVTGLHFIHTNSSRLTIFNLSQAMNGDVFLTGYLKDTVVSANAFYPHILRIDRQGNEVWQKTFQGPLPYFGIIQDIHEYAPERFFLTGSIESLVLPNERYNVFWKMDGQGNVTWSQRLDFDGVGEFSETVSAQNGNMLILSYMFQSVGWGHSVTDTENTSVIEVDTSGNVIQIRHLDDITGYDFIQQNDSTIAFLARYFNSSNEHGYAVMRMDEQGNVRSARPFDSPIPNVNPFDASGDDLEFGPNGRLYHIVNVWDTINEVTYSYRYVVDGFGTPACNPQDTLFSSTVSLTPTQSAFSLPDTTYGVTIDSFPVVSAPYPNLILSTLCESPCVWPGDANNSGTCNLDDLLYIGIAYNSSGPARFVNSIEWYCHGSTDWPQTFASGLPHQHADCNGDGTVDAADTNALPLNYGLTHQKAHNALDLQTTDPTLYIVVPQDSALVGDTIHAAIYLGTSSLQVDSIYGISFRILYDPALVDSGTARIDFDSSWIGTTAQTLSMDQDVYPQGFIDGAIVRTGGVNVSGYGQIATASFVLIDNIEGKRDITETLHLEIGGYTALTYLENPLTFSTGHDSVVVENNENAVVPEGQDLFQTIIFPNPSTSTFQIQVDGARPMSYQVLDVLGKRVMEGKMRKQEFQLDFRDLPAGVYLLGLKTDRGMAHHKLVKR